MVCTCFVFLASFFKFCIRNCTKLRKSISSEFDLCSYYHTYNHISLQDVLWFNLSKYSNNMSVCFLTFQMADDIFHITDPHWINTSVLMLICTFEVSLCCSLSAALVASLVVQTWHDDLCEGSGCGLSLLSPLREPHRGDLAQWSGRNHVILTVS